MWSHSFFCFPSRLISSYCFNNNIAVFKSFWNSWLLYSPYSYKLVDVFVLWCKILCVLTACTIFTVETFYTHKIVLAVVFRTEAAMSSVRAECKEAGMLCSVPTLRLRSSNPHHLAGESFSAQREPSLPVAGGKGTQDQPNTRKQRSRYTREGNTIKNSCKCNSGQRRRPPGFCWELCFWKLCSAQVRPGPCWCSPLLHEHALSSKSSTSMLYLAHSDTLPGWEPQPQSRGR